MQHVLVVLCLLALATPSVHAATDPPDACTATKAKAAGDKAAALLRAFGKNSKAPNVPRFSSALSKAQAKFTRAFSRAESKGGCLTAGDVSVIGAKVDAFVADAANSAGRVGGEFQVNTYTTGNQTIPAVGMAAGGSFVVVWAGQNQQDGDSSGVFGQRYDAAGTPVGAEFQVNTYTTGSQSSSEIGVAPDGTAAVTWQSANTGDPRSIFGQRYDSAGVPVGPEFQVNTYTTGFQLRQRLDVSADGDFVVVWRSIEQIGDSVFGQRYDNAGMPVGSEFLVNTYTTGTQSDPDVGVAADGAFVVVWSSEDQDGNNAGVFGQRYDSAGTPLGSEFQVNTHTPNSQFRPFVDVDSAGAFVVVWTSVHQDGDDWGVFGQRYDSAGAAVGAEFRVNAHTAGRQECQDIAITADGENFVVVFTGFHTGDFTGDGIQARRFRGAGIAEAPEFRVDLDNLGGRPALGAAPEGDFIVVWASYLADGSEDGVVGQRFRR